MSRSEVGAMYGREGAYYGGAPASFKNDVWIELIGFDNTLEDFGVGELLDRMGFVPSKFLLLLSGIDFINLHRGCDQEYELDPFYCSYEGHPKGDDHAIQRWTNWQLKELVNTLHQRGIEVYPGFFDPPTPSGSFFDEHPEVYVTKWRNEELSTEPRVYMTKRLADGSYYEDFFLQKTIEVLRDYGFDGVHLPDGICRPRRPLQNSEYSADMLDQAGIIVPEGENPALYILEHHRREWLDFCTARWSSYLEKVIGGIHAAGFKVVTNSCWTKDPLEAWYRYGVDYRTLDRMGIDGCVVENGAPTISIIDTESNAGFKQTYADRQLVHHTFRSSLMCVRAQMRNISLQPLCHGIKIPGQLTDLISGTDAGALEKIAFGYFPGRHRQPAQLIGHCVGQSNGKKDPHANHRNINNRILTLLSLTNGICTGNIKANQQFQLLIPDLQKAADQQSVSVCVRYSHIAALARFRHRQLILQQFRSAGLE